MLAIGLMALLLLIPLLMVEDQISDRAQRQREVQDNIANSAAGEQVLAGPVQVVHYRVTVEVPAESEKTGPRRQVVDRTLLLPPSKLNLDGEAGVETRQRGIYQARLFRLTANGSGYLDGLNAVGVRGTLKHFPGLGRVRTDTHLRPAILAS